MHHKIIGGFTHSKNLLSALFGPSGSVCTVCDTEKREAGIKADPEYHVAHGFVSSDSRYPTNGYEWYLNELKCE